MKFYPDKTKVINTHDQGKPQVVWTTLVADLETPVAVMLKLTEDNDNCFLLESVQGGSNRARYSMIGLDPDLIFKAEGNNAFINTNPNANSQTFTPLEEETLDALRTLIAEAAIDLPEELPPMSAGIFGYLGYDTVRLIEDLPNQNEDILNLPDAIMMRPQAMVIFDSVKDEISIVTPIRPAKGINAEQAHAKAIDRITRILDKLDTPLSSKTADTITDLEIKVTSNTSPQDYMEKVKKAQEYITAGDIFQVVLSQRFESDFTLQPFSLYRALRRTNPSPFLFYLKFDGFSVAGSSPEILVSVKDDTVTIRPIAGTRLRGATPEEDKANGDDLLQDKKELAEHLMLLDLGRNDVGRVSEIGSVTVTDQFFLEYYSHVMHIVSNVTGKLSNKYDILDALSGGFPAGTVSGAPKVRAMEIIDELETQKRGIYAGCVGYFSAGGDMDTCIVLRTAIVKDGKMYVQAGAGIVADSIPESEQAECVNKAKALFSAAEEAVRFADQSKRGQ